MYLDNREEFRPKPRADGIVAEIEAGSYDYWAIRRNGDFYSMSSFMEDRLGQGGLFFDTRIQKTAESLLYCARLFSTLGVDRSTTIHFSLKLTGLKDRILRAANNLAAINFLPLVSKSVEDEIFSEVKTSIQDIEANIVSLVKQIVSPTLTLFDFFELPDKDYEKLVNQFVPR